MGSALIRAAVTLAAVGYAGAAIYSVTLAEREAQARERRGALVFKAVTEGAGDLILRLSPQGDVRFASAASKLLLGLAPDEIVGRSVFDFVLAGDRAALADLLRDAASLGRPASAEVRMVRAGGGVAWMEFRCDPAHDGAGPGTPTSSPSDATPRPAGPSRTSWRGRGIWRSGRIPRNPSSLPI